VAQVNSNVHSPHAVSLAGNPVVGMDPAIATGTGTGYLVNSVPFLANGDNNPVGNTLGLWTLTDSAAVTTGSGTVSLTSKVLPSEPYAFPVPATSTGDGSTHTVNGMVITPETALNPDDSRLSGPVEVTRGFGGQIQLWTALDAAVSLIAGTVPGVIAGSIIRVELLPGPRVFALVIAAVLVPLGIWLALTRPSRAGEPERPARLIPAPVLVVLAAAVGCAGGIYGIGGGSILAPILLGTGRKASEVAPAALASTFVTSVAGVITFTILALYEHGSVAPAWPTGIALGIGGLAGAYTGARFQSRMPDALIRRLMGILVIAIGAQYLWSGLS
jgi:uncharacterized protein